MVEYEQRKTIPDLGTVMRVETVYWEFSDDYVTVYETANGVKVEESTDERAFIHWYDVTGTFDEVLAEILEEGF